MREMSFKEYVNQSAFEDWIYENICADGNFKIDWEKERVWISDTAFTRQAVSNTKRETFRPVSENQRHFDPMLLEYGGGQITITVDKTGLITVTGSAKIRLNENFVARIYVDRIVGRGINGIDEVYYDIPVQEVDTIWSMINNNKFIQFKSVFESSTIFNDEVETQTIIINTDNITDVQVYSYVDYAEYIQKKEDE